MSVAKRLALPNRDDSSAGNILPVESANVGSMGVYVHFPWCLQKCPYCDFLSIAAKRPEIPSGAYADAVIAELGRRAEQSGKRIASVFFGGGTPSLWNPSDLGRVLRAIFETFGVDRARVGELEVTVECNPSSFDADLGRALVDVGVNRVSIGVQSLDEARLAFLGRLHDVDGGLRAVRDAVAAGVPRVSADLIFGVHGQSPERAAQEALRVAELGITHLSAYALTIEPGTEFGARAKKGTLPLLTDDKVADSFLAVDEALRAARFDHYEISNFARHGHTARHNLGYWQGRDYLGLGCGAWGTVTNAREPSGARVRYRNTPSKERYLAAAGEVRHADLERAGPGELQSVLELIDAETALRERLMLGLRLADGVDVDAAGQELGIEPWTEPRQKAVASLVERGRLRREGSRLSIPRDARLFADGTIAELI